MPDANPLPPKERMKIPYLAMPELEPEVRAHCFAEVNQGLSAESADTTRKMRFGPSIWPPNDLVLNSMSKKRALRARPHLCASAAISESVIESTSLR
jgi:hypothetical protein